MKTQIRPLITFVSAASASLLITTAAAQAGFIVTLEQVGPKVVATGRGAMDVRGLHFTGPASSESLINPSAADITIGVGVEPAGIGPSYFANISGPTNFGNGGLTLATTASGDLVPIDPRSNLLVVPILDGSFGPLSDSSTYENATFRSLGLRRGTYKWTWGPRPNQNFTLQVVSAPDSGSTIGS